MGQIFNLPSPCYPAEQIANLLHKRLRIPKGRTHSNTILKSAIDRFAHNPISLKRGIFLF